MRRLDYIIVGGGVAGCYLAFQLARRGRRLLVFDVPTDGAASAVAAGVVNPITGKRLAKSWKSEVAHGFAKKFYSRLERELGTKFYRPRKILQLCKSGEENGLWERRTRDPAYAPMLGAPFKAGTFPALNDAFGSRVVERSAWVEASALMPAFSSRLLKRGMLVREFFDVSKLRTSERLLRYGDISSKRIVFCEGWRAVYNPYFSWLPYRPAKGEILTLRGGVELPDYIIHRGNWLMKCGGDLFRTGSTWDRENLDGNPTRAAELGLAASLRGFFAAPCVFRTVSHEAGVRPCTATTRPFLGFHPADCRILSFNGFGSKGFALSPYFADVFASHIEDGGPLDAEADLKRHAEKFYAGRGVAPKAV